MNEQLIINKMEKFGVPIENTMRRFLNDKQFYIQCLVEFVKDKNFIELKNALKNEQYAQLFDITYGMNGVALNLGLDKISDELTQIISNIRNNKYGSINEHILKIDSMVCDIKLALKDEKI